MKKMKTLIPVFVTIFLLSAPVYADDFQDGLRAYDREDYKTALGKWKPLAEQGAPKAQFKLGDMYNFGEGVTKNHEEAVKWYRFSAEHGNSDAQNNLGVNYENGRGVRQNHKEAAKWYRFSAEQGNSEAQNNLGVLYYLGKGVSKDYKEAHKWFIIAGANGHEQGRKNVAIIEKQMTPNQVAETQKLAREWMERHGKE